MDLSRLAPQLLDLISEAIVVTDATGQCVSANAAASNLTGYTQAELTHLRLDDLVSAASPLAADADRRAEVLTVRRKDGGECSVTAQAHPVGNYQASVWRESPAQAEGASPPNEALLRAVFETMTEAVATHQIIYDAAGAPVDYVILDVNPAYTAHTGLTRERVVGRCASEAYLTDEAPYLDIYARVAETGTPEHHEIYVDQTQAHYSISVFSPGPGQFTTVFGNITERKRTEAALKESEERYRHLVETMNEGFGIRDENGICTYANDRLCQMLGYAREEIVGHRLEDFIDAGSLKEYQRQWAKQVEGEAAAYEIVWATKDGQRVPTIASPRVILDEAGHFKGSFAVITDITERETTEAALRESERKYRDLVENISDVLCLITTDGVVEYISPVITSYSGFTPDEIIGRLITDFIHPEDHPRLRENMRNVLTGKTQPAEYRYITKSSSVRWLRSSSRPFLVDGKVVGLRGVLTDVTDRKQAEAAQRESESRFRRMAESIQDGLTIIENGEVVYVNDRLCEIFGYSEAEMKRLSIFEIAAPEERERLQRIREEALASCTPHQDYEFWIVRKDGTRRCVQSRYAISYDGDQAVGRFVVTTDITERKLAEEALQRAHEELERRVAARTEELAQERNLLRLLIDHLPDYVSVKDLDSQFMVVNRAHVRHLGHTTPEGVIGKTDFDFYPRELADQYYADEQAIIQSGSPMIDKEEPGLGRQGNALWLLSTKLPLRDAHGDIIGLLAVSRDITEQKQTAQKLREERNLLRTLIDNMPDLIFVKDAEARFVLLNETFTRLVGDDLSGDLIGLTDFDVHPRDMAERYYADDMMVIRSGQPLLNREEPFIGRTTDAQTWLSTIKVPLRDPNGNVVGLVGMSRDITAYKHAEAALQQAHDELELRVEARTADLKRANTQLYAEIVERKLAEQRATRLLNQQTAANQLAIALGDSSDLNRIYDTIYMHVRTLMDVEAFIVAFFDEEAQLIRAGFAVSGNARLDVATFPPIPLTAEGYGDQSEVIRTGRPLYIPDYREASRQTRAGYTIEPNGSMTWSPPLPEEQAHSIQSALLVPLKIEGKTIGVVQVQSNRLDAYSSDNVDLLASLANVAAIAIQNARLFAERTRAEEKLRASEKQYRMIFTHAPLGVMHFDEHGVILDLNEKFAEIIGAPREQLLGLDTLARTRDPQVLSAMQEALAGNLGYYEGDYLSVTSGKLTPVRAFFYTITGEDGQFLGGAGLVEDITARRRAEDALYRRQRELESLLEIGHELSSILDLDRLLRLIAQRVIELLDADEFTLFRLEADSKTLKPVLALGEYADAMLARTLKVGEGITGYSVARNQPVIANDAHQDRRSVQVADTPERTKEHLLAVPLAFRDQITGAILVNRVNKPHHFTEEDQDLLAGLANKAAIAIENARLFEAERDQRVLAEALRDTAAALNSLDLDDVLNRILANVGRVLPYDTASIMLVESGVAHIVRCQGYAERGISEDAVKALRFPISEVSNMRQMTETGKPCVVADVLTHPGWVASPETAWIRANVSAPIRTAGEVIGFLDLNSAAPNTFTGVHAERLQAFADQAATAIRNAQVYAQAQQRAAQLSTLNKIGQAVTSRLELDTVLEVAHAQVRQILPLDAFFVCLYDPETEIVTFPLLYDEGVRYEETPKPLLRNTLIDQAIVSGEPALLNRSARELELAAPTQSVGNVGRVSASLMYAPLKVGEQVIGAISAQSYTLNAYHADDLSLLAGVANQVAIAIENARLYAQTQQRAAELSMLNEIGRAVSSLLDLDGVLEVTYEQVRRNLPLDLFFVSLYDSDTNEVTFPLIYDNGVRYDQTSELLLPDTFIGQTIAASAPLLFNRSAEELQTLAPKYPIGHAGPAASMLFAPLRVGARRLTGVISAQSYTVNAYSSEHLKVLMGVANQVAIAVENARLHTEVQRQNEELEQRVEERTAELRQALTHAQEADRAKSDFVSSVNHELRTPLANLKLYVRLLRKGHPEKQALYLDTLDREISRLSALVEDTLALASMGRKQPEMETVNLAEIAKETVIRFATLAESRRIALNIQAGEAVWVRADANQITRVLINLLGNAITYTAGGGAVNLSVDARTVVGGRWAVLTVSDTGPGISPEDQKRIFTPYYRGQTGREFGVPGSGLGLALVKEIVQLHHGRIELESTVGRGTAFRVWLPLV